MTQPNTALHEDSAQQPVACIKFDKAYVNMTMVCSRTTCTHVIRIIYMFYISVCVKSLECVIQCSSQQCVAMIDLEIVVQLTEKKKTKSRKRRRHFLHDDALALASKVSSRYCIGR